MFLFWGWGLGLGFWVWREGGGVKEYLEWSLEMVERWRRRREEREKGVAEEERRWEAVLWREMREINIRAR